MHVIKTRGVECKHMSLSGHTNTIEARFLSGICRNYTSIHPHLWLYLSTSRRLNRIRWSVYLIRYNILCFQVGRRGIYRVSQEECARLRESVPYVKLYRYNPKHLCPKLNGYADNGQRKVWFSLVSTYCTPSVTSYLSNTPARQLDMVMQWPWRLRYSVR